ncbi:unnamed protein product, partial [Protopolystoma xenopodis]
MITSLSGPHLSKLVGLWDERHFTGISSSHFCPRSSVWTGGFPISPSTEKAFLVQRLPFVCGHHGLHQRLQLLGPVASWSAVHLEYSPVRRVSAQRPVLRYDEERNERVWQ